MGLISDFFGGNEDAAKANKRSVAYSKQMAEQARGDALELFSLADANRNLGLQSAMDVFGQSAPQQINAFQGGNIAAQQSLLAGMPQYQNAIMGNEINMQGLRPFQAGVDMSTFQQQLPDFEYRESPLSGVQK